VVDWAARKTGENCPSDFSAWPVTEAQCADGILHV
jgi:hypothetical protein